MKKGTRTTLIVLGVIALVFIFFAFFTETEIKIEVNTKDATPEYATYEECLLKEHQKCAPLKCGDLVSNYCDTLDFKEEWISKPVMF